MGATATFTDKRPGHVIALQQELMVTLSKARKSIGSTQSHDMTRDQRLLGYEEAAGQVMKSVALLTQLIDTETAYEEVES